ncbi:hypothetical protein K466DRAFT_469381, partial [Polyporus arcularius HHB13444]
DMPTLLNLRATSHSNLAAVKTELDHSLRELLGPFLCDVPGFLLALANNRAFVGGSIAVAFLLRDLTVKPRNVDIFVPKHSLIDILNHLVTHENAMDRTPPLSEDATDDEFERHVGLEKLLRLRGVGERRRTVTPRGEINLYASLEDDALLPVARSWGTPAVSYVGPHQFGTAFPSLFFERRGLVGSCTQDDTETIGLDAQQDHKSVQKYVSRGFDIRMSPSQWSYRTHGGLCGASRGLCPMQPRRFDDQWAMSATF